MFIALDFDNTYSRDPEFWNTVIASAQHAGHEVYCVTMRNEGYESREVREALANKVDGIFFTDRKAKQPYMFARGICIDVWIDDNPIWINTDAAS